MKPIKLISNETNQQQGNKMPTNIVKKLRYDKIIFLWQDKCATPAGSADRLPRLSKRSAKAGLVGINAKQTLGDPGLYTQKGRKNKSK